MIKRRSLVFQFVVYVLTFGLYSLYWYYSTLEEMAKFNGEKINPILWTIMLVIPGLNFWAMWKHASAADKAFEKEYPAILLWLLWIFISPAVWILVQIELNRIAGAPLPESPAVE